MSLQDFITKQKFKALITDYGDYFEFDVPSFGGMLAVQKGFAPSLNWYEAKEYAKNLNLGGYNDWTIPTKEELIALFQLQKIYKLEESDDSFWSSTYVGRLSTDPSLFTVSFLVNSDDTGLVLSTSLDFYPLGKVFFARPADWYSRYNVRCVRIDGAGEQEKYRDRTNFVKLVAKNISWTSSAEELIENFIDRGDYIEFKKPVGTIKMIQKIGKKIFFKAKEEFFEELNGYLRSLRSGGYNDWRIPTPEECKIIDQIKIFSGIHYDFESRDLHYLNYLKPDMPNDRSLLSINLFAVR
ncbi:DUF1566 domain-containing protein [bacterium]|nr:DUF1566 domain-containing protein [bacterium]